MEAFYHLDFNHTTIPGRYQRGYFQLGDTEAHDYEMMGSTPSYTAIHIHDHLRYGFPSEKPMQQILTTWNTASRRVPTPDALVHI